MHTFETAICSKGGTAVPRMSERTSERVLEWARCQPDAPAMSDDSNALSYRGLADAVHETVGTLHSLGIQPGDRVLIVGENSVALGVILLAASHLGACAVLENARRVAAEIRGIAAHCAPKRIIFMHASSPDAVQHCAAFGAQEHHARALGAFGVVAPAAEAPDAEPAPADVAVIIYTTGTTGQPKGVMLTHGNLSFIAAMMRELRHLTPQDRVYGVLPITHVMGHASVFLGTLHAGASLHLVARFSPQQCVDTLLQRRISVLQGAPAMFAKIVEHCKAARIEGFEHIRFIGSGGAPIDATIKREAEALFGCVLQNGYGLTEAASSCWTRFEDTNDDDSVGRPLPGMELAIRDPDRHPVAAGEVGELWVRGPNVMLGYFRNPQMTAQVIDAERWFNTQDLGCIAGDGRVFIVGRTKDVIIRSGFKVYPLEVESALNSHPEVLHCAVVGRKVAGNEEVVAYVELVKNARARAADLSQHAAQLLSPYKRPTRVVIMPSLPLAANGKVLKSQLPQQEPQSDNRSFK